MRRFYGLDLAEALYGPRRLSVGRLRALVERLPPESSLAFEQGSWWTPELELLATIAESIGEVLRMLQAFGGRKGSIKNPITIRRPKPTSANGVKPEKRPATIDDYRRMFDVGSG
jgi:hypothetical protein